MQTHGVWFNSTGELFRLPLLGSPLRDTEELVEFLIREAEPIPETVHLLRLNPRGLEDGRFHPQ